MKEKETKYTIKLCCDKTELMRGLDEIEKRLDRITEKANQLATTLGESCLPTDKQ